MVSRTINSLRNSVLSMIAQVVSIILNFIGRTFFIKLLNIDYLGVNGLFTNILTILSLAELGIGSAIIYMMYSPIARGDTRKIAAYSLFFKKIYTIIGSLIFLIGLCLLPFLHYIIKDAPQIKENLSIVYVLFLINTSISYFFTYKRSLLIAHQKEYLNSINVIVFTVLKDVLLIVLLLCYKNYYIYLVAQIIVTFLSNYSVSKVADQQFSEIVNIKDALLTKEEKKIIGKNTLAMLCHKIGSVVVSGTDNIFISSFIGIATVGIYSNYKLVQRVILQLITQIVNSVTASVGNLIATSDKIAVFTVFNRLYFVNFALAYFSAIVFYAVIDPFITIWIGEKYLLSNIAVFIIALNLYLNQIRVPSQVLINAYGLFWNVKWKSIVEAVVNFIFSFFMIVYMKLGVEGILWGTLISNVLTNIWWEPFVAYKYGLCQPLKLYIRIFAWDFLIFIISMFLVKEISIRIVEFSVLNKYVLFVCVLFLSLFLSLAIFIIVYWKNENLEFLKTTLFNIILKLKK